MFLCFSIVSFHYSLNKKILYRSYGTVIRKTRCNALFEDFQNRTPHSDCRHSNEKQKNRKIFIKTQSLMINLYFQTENQNFGFLLFVSNSDRTFRYRENFRLSVSFHFIISLAIRKSGL